MDRLLDAWRLGPLATTLLLAPLALYLLFTHLAHRKAHPSEPPLVAPPIPLPYLGHLLALALHGGHHLRALGLRHAAAADRPAVTLAVPFSRLYLVTSPALALALQRRPDALLSFDALLPAVVQRVMGLDAPTRAILQRGVDGGGGQAGGVLAELHAMLAARLGPGPGVEALTLRAARELDAELERFVAAKGLATAEDHAVEEASTPAAKEREEEEEGEQDLLAWVRHLVTPATARLLYGARHPLAARSPDERAALEQAFWDFDHGLGRLLLGVLPALTAAKAYAGREALVAAFTTYLSEQGEDGGADGADAIVRERIRIATAHGFARDGVARSELSFLFAGIVNTATTTFWMLARVCADRPPGLLRAVRGELAGLLVGAPEEERSGGGGGGGKRQLSLRKLLARENCPLLHAVYKEVLRLGSNHASARLVREDTRVAAAGAGGGEIWLRKGGVVQIAGGVMHANAALWGDDVAAFHPARHLKNTSGGPAVHPAAFRAFGGGRTICPGRHFATGEILALVSCVLLRFEMEGVGADKRIRVPELDDYILPVHILEPVAGSPVRVKIRLREGADGAEVEVVP